MKALFIGNSIFSLSNFRFDLMKEFRARGFEVVAISPDHDAALVEKLRSAGLRHEVLNLSRTGLNPLSDFCFFLGVWRLIGRERPSLVLAYTVKPVIYASLAARLRRVPKVVALMTGLGYAFTEGGSALRKMLKNFVVLLYRVALGRRVTLVFQNPDDRKLFTSLGLIQAGQHCLQMKGSGVDIRHFSQAPFPQMTGGLRFLLVARLLADKGIREYAEAARLLKNSGVLCECLLLGPRDENPAAISQAEIVAWTEAGLIRYLGETRDVRPFLKDSHVFVLPSYREGTPKSALEALAVGRPVITTQAPGCRETVEEGINGYLVPVGDAQALSQAMLRFVRDPSLVDKMGQESRRRAEDVYESGRVNRGLLDSLGV